MPDTSILGALPIGLLIFLGLFWGMHRRRTGLRRARDEYPGLARELGLTHRPPPFARMVGPISGERLGRRIYVDPDERMRIFVGLRSPVPIDLRSYRRNQRAGPNMSSFHIGRGPFERLFITRHASGHLADALIDHRDALDDAARALERLRNTELKELAVTSEGAECVFDFGKPPYLPAARVRSTLPLLEWLLECIETAQAQVLDGVETEPEGWE